MMRALALTTAMALLATGCGSAAKVEEYERKQAEGMPDSARIGWNDSAGEDTAEATLVTGGEHEPTPAPTLPVGE